MSLDPNQSYYIGFVIESALWGAYTIIFGFAVHYSNVQNKRRPVNKILFSAMVALYVLSTTHFSLVFRHMYQGLMVNFSPVGVEDNILEGADILNYTTDFIGQMVLAYRCWYVWGQRWSIVALPLLMSLTSYIFSLVGMGMYIRVDHGLVAGQSTTNMMTAAFDIALGVPVGTDLLLTGLIVGRIWYISRWTPELLSTRRIHAAIEIIIESGAMVILVQLITSILFFRNSASQNIGLCILAQIYGIAPTLIILRIGMGKSIDTTMHGTITSVRFADPTTSVTVEKEYQDASHGSFSGGSGTPSTTVDSNIV